MSRHLAGLERALATTLVERTARRVTLTDAGAELLADAREVLAAVDHLEHRARAFARGRLGGVTVGFVWSTLPAYLPRLVTAAAAHHPEIELAVSQQRFAAIPTALRRRDIDLAITRPTADDDDLIAETLNREPCVIALTVGHPLADAATVSVADLDGASLITLARETVPSVYDAAAAALAARGVRPAGVRAAGSPSEALALVAAGLGVYYRLPWTAASPVPGVVYRELVDAPMDTVLLRRCEPSPPAVTAIRELAVACLADAPDASDDAPGGDWLT